MIFIFLSRISTRQEVVAFLEELKAFLEGNDFDIDHDLILIKKKKLDDEAHSTPYTLLDLDYNSEDVVKISLCIVNGKAEVNDGGKYSY